MGQLKIIDSSQQTTGNINTTAYGAPINVSAAQSISFQSSVTVNTPAAKTFASTAVNTSTNRITIATHGYVTGTLGQISNPGTLPTGITAVTDYYVILVDANTIKIATTLAHALAGTAVVLSAQGSGTNTFTPTALSGGSVSIQKSKDLSAPTIWSTDGSATNITQTGVIWFENLQPSSVWVRAAYTLTAGQYVAVGKYCVKGLA